MPVSAVGSHAGSRTIEMGLGWSSAATAPPLKSLREDSLKQAFRH